MKTRTNQPVVAEGTPSGTIDEVLGVDANGNIVKGSVSGGTKLYRHEFTLTTNNIQYNFNVILATSDRVTLSNLTNLLKNRYLGGYIIRGLDSVVISYCLTTYDGDPAIYSVVYSPASGQELRNTDVIESVGYDVVSPL